MESLGVEMVRELWGGRFVDWTFLPAQGVAGGVLLGGEGEEGATSVTASMRMFSSFIDDVELVDLPMQGGAFTWSGGGVLSRLDRFLVTGDWEEHFSHVTQTRLHRPVSDHWPVLLDSGGIRSGPTPFRFENMWLSSDGFLEQVKGWWDCYVLSGLPSFCLAQKLKLLKSDLKRWNREVFGRLEVQKADVLAVLQELDVLESDGILSAADLRHRDD
ncbi:hypothetical protein LOK49_LG03G01116, partial [Camellia lanceoleosa]